MKTIVIYTSGTLGDHVPFFALGQALQRRGHRVRLMINQAMHAAAAQAGLEAFAYTDIERGPEHTRENAWAWNHWRNAEIPVEIPSLPDIYAQYLTQVQEMAAICQGADLLLATSIRTHGMVVAQAARLPWMTVSFNAMTFTPPAAAEQTARQQARQVEYQAYRPVIDYVYEKLGLPLSAPDWRPGWTFARHILLASSAHFSRVDLNQLQPHSSIDQTGFWFYDDPAWQGWQPDPALAAFCARRPLALAFSSQPVEDPRRILHVHVEAARLLGMPLLVQRGWAGFDESDLPAGTGPEQVFFAGELPHDWLFAQAAAAIQHGGIGSIARALRQGCPLLIEPFGNDQFYNANQVMQLRVGGTAAPFEMTGESLARTLEQNVLTPAARGRARQVGDRMQAEDGLGDACELIERYLSRLGQGGIHPGVYDKFTPPLTPRSRQAPVPAANPRGYPARLFDAAPDVPEHIVPEAEARRLLETPAALPLISCLMVTNDRPELARRAIECFLRQDYPRCELVIVDEGQSDELQTWVSALNHPRLRHFRVAGPRQPLGALRNLSVQQAVGEFVAVWDDDDLYHPSRLLYQMAALLALQAEACCLQREFIWWPNSRRLAISNERVWENTLLARKASLPPYPPLPAGSDTPVLESLQDTVPLALVDYPQLYVHVFHGGNVRSAAHWEDFWAAASARFAGERYDQVRQTLQNELAVNMETPVLPAPVRAGGAAAPADPIPHILHQTWKDANLPPNLRAWQRTWLENHPTWQYRLWTDQDLRAFMQEHYAWFLPIYDSYPQPIQRVDAARYFILYHYGGVYADLDTECLRPLDELLEGRRMMVGLEPERHLQQPAAQIAGLERLLCNAIMASAPGQPFWEHVQRQLVACHRLPGPLDSTGPFFLTRALSSAPDPAAIHLEPASTFYPVDKDTPWVDLPLAERQRLTGDAYTVHHWLGGWWRVDEQIVPKNLPVRLFQHSVWLTSGILDSAESLKGLESLAEKPLVSCLMVTRGRLRLAQRSISNFQRQTYPELELVIVCDDPDPALQQWVAALDDPRLCFLALPDEGRPLGELRNLALQHAGGAYVAQWDDDDLSDPLRLQVQMAAMHAMRADACILERHQVWWPDQERLAYSTRRFWESSFVCRKEIAPAYPPLRRGEDTQTLLLMVRSGRTVQIDAPRLYTYVFHGANTFAAPHWEQQWLHATMQFTGSPYRQEIRFLQKRLGLVEAEPHALASPDADSQKS